MEFEAVGDQRNPDQHQEGERQHLGGGVLGDEVADRIRRHIHDDHGDDHGGDHHLQVFGHADGRDDRIQREHEIDRNQLNHDPAKGVGSGADLGVTVTRLDLGVDLMRGLGDEKQAAADQDDVAPGYSHLEDGDDRLGEPHQPGEPEQHDHAEDEGERKPDLAGAARLLRLEPRGQDRDENEIVDAEHDLERGQGDERGPGMRIGQERESVHMAYFPEKWIPVLRRSRKCDQM